MNAFIIRQTRRVCFLYTYAGESVDVSAYPNRAAALAALGA